MLKVVPTINILKHVRETLLESTTFMQSNLLLCDRTKLKDTDDQSFKVQKFIFTCNVCIKTSENVVTRLMESKDKNDYNFISHIHYE